MTTPPEPTFPTRPLHMRNSHIVLLLFLAPLLAAAAPCDAQQAGYKSGVSSDGGKIEYVWLDDSKGIEVRASGELDLREDAPDVEGISPRGYLIVQQRVGSALHRAEWRPAAGGGVARSYTIDGRRRDFTEARPWLDRFFPEVLRHTSIDVRARFRRVLAQRGVAGVLEEAAAAGSGRTRELFLEGLAERDLTPSETQRFLQALGGVSSSSTRRELLLKIARRPLTADQWTSWLTAASSATSDGDRADLLRRAVARYPRNRPLPDAFYRALDGISSSAFRRDVLTNLVTTRGAEPGTLDGAMAAIAKLSSSSERREMLLQVAKLPFPDGALPQYLRLAGSLASSDRREVLAAMIHNPTVLRTGPAAVAWLGAVKQLSSDSDKAVLLIGAIGRLPADRSVRAAYSEALETVSSDTYYNQIATAYLRSQAERS